MSYVSIRVCGRFFEVWGRPFPTSGKSAVVSDGEIISAGLVSDNFRKGDAFSELPANAPAHSSPAAFLRRRFPRGAGALPQAGLSFAVRFSHKAYTIII